MYQKGHIPANKGTCYLDTLPEEIRESILAYKKKRGAAQAKKWRATRTEAQRDIIRKRDKLYRRANSPEKKRAMAAKQLARFSPEELLLLKAHRKEYNRKYYLNHVIPKRLQQLSKVA